jgi:NAD-dependent dihydropyrimidine dehydrogenase PreA subunit
VVTVTAPVADDAAEVPAAFVAVTVNVGVAPVAIPETTIGDDAPVAVCPVDAVTVYEDAA